MTRSQRIGIALVIIATAIVSGALGFWLRRFMDQDGCLDAGGRWNHAYNFCERLMTEEEAFPSEP